MLVHATTSYLPYVLLKATMCIPCALISSSRSFYQCSRPMTSHHVNCHVTAMSHASSLLIKEIEIQKKRNRKSRKIDKRKRKMLVSKAFQKHSITHVPCNQLLIKKNSSSTEAKVTPESHLYMLENVPMLFQCLPQIFL